MSKRSTAEQLETLDNFQRAEFLRKMRIHSECIGRINGLREKTRALYEKKGTDADAYEKIQIGFAIFFVVSLSLLMVFGSSEAERLCHIILCAMIWGLGILFKQASENHDAFVFEMLILEISRYESELRINGLSESYSTYLGESDSSEGLYRDILESLGFRSDMLGSGAAAFPLDARE
ncbi:MAG: hypothetical protein NTU86_14035 [Burkholderiales bacterium]|nr:hypothetical protein [Burkholderiales bacterium]